MSSQVYHLTSDIKAYCASTHGAAEFEKVRAIFGHRTLCFQRPSGSCTQSPPRRQGELVQGLPSFEVFRLNEAGEKKVICSVDCVAGLQVKDDAAMATLNIEEQRVKTTEMLKSAAEWLLFLKEASRYMTVT